MSEELDIVGNEEMKPRPGFLIVLCVLSFISLGLGGISGLINMASGPSSEEQMLETRVELTKSISDLKDVGMDGLAGMMDQIQGMTEEINNSFYFASTLNLLIVIAGLFGVIKMWKGFRLGFHVYIVYCLLSIGSMYLYVSPSNIPSFIVIINLIISGLFIFMYSRNLKWMTN